MENAARQAMARERRPVRCRNCGYYFTPVSGFCPNCLELRPLGRRIAVVPLIALLGLAALGAAGFPASRTGSIALGPGPRPFRGGATPSAILAEAARPRAPLCA